MISISFDETHHLLDGKPLYDTRYTRVMSFHDNIAPVELDDTAFFINIDNQKLFNRTFVKAYGFYEGMSAVCDKNGWFHIDTNGSEVYAHRYAWVGNFQENLCVVRDHDNNYFHITRNGECLYNMNYSYTGDFKYSIAVVINKEGKATHINSKGDTFHNKYFEELDIFHKGFAIAKDSRGYFHINKNGDELYSDRYQKLEPFYNGVALATSYQNQKVIIDEKKLSPTAITEEYIDQNKILDESFGYFRYQILFSILKLDILQKLKEDNEIVLPSVSKQLIYRWLQVERLITKDLSLTAKGEVINSKLKPLILYWQDLPFKVSANLVAALKKGDEVFTEMYEKPFFDYLQNNKSLQELTSLTHEYYTTDYSLLLDQLCLTNEVVCDIGGGSGTLLTEIKQEYKGVTTVLLDRLTNKTEHEFIMIDFLSHFTIKADVFILSRILHDWSDEKAQTILQNVAQNMTFQTTLYIFETIVPNYSIDDKGHTLSFHLLSFLGGFERTLQEYKILLHTAGLHVVKTYMPNNLISIIEVKK